ncbi:hypothetical protein HPB52_000199 [Rhipicephalus sanguineus]|uniref:Tick transposon n=1 Tax=Rhipicephalus sanguineus TaxID=34632 RepID=A0A9D4PHC8_RHISA|nr:hypothetical protein HPB52_000199 [Rhipicephalus sanguineus]
MARVPENERWEIVELYFKGRSQRKNAEATGRTLKAVNRIVRAFKSCRRIKDAPRKPRSRITTEQEDAWIVAAAAVKPGLSAQQIKNTLDLRAFVTTVKRRLREAGCGKLKDTLACGKLSTFTTVNGYVYPPMPEGLPKLNIVEERQPQYFRSHHK